MSNAAPVDPPEDTAPPILVAVPPLGELLAGDPPDFDQEPVAPVDADQANRWLYRIAQLDAADAADIEIANTERARIDLWLSLQLQRRAHDRDWLTKSLTLMHETYLRSAGKGAPKTIHLPNGDLISRAQEEEWEYEDEAAFIAWAEANERDELLRRPKTEPDKNAVKTNLAPPKKVLDSLEPGTELDVLASEPCPTCSDLADPDERCDTCGGSGFKYTTVPGLIIRKRPDKVTIKAGGTR